MIEELRCKNCNKKIGEHFTGHIEVVCPRCGHYNVFSSDLTNKEEGNRVKIIELK